MSRRDPVERASRGDGIYEVTDWEPRSVLDWVVVVVHSSLVAGAKWAVVLAGLVITGVIVAVTALDLVLEPFVTALVATSVLPALALALYVRSIDVTTPEPLGVLSATFLLAVITAGFAALLNDLGSYVVNAVAAPMGEFVALALVFFFVVGPVEEGVKLLAVRLYAYNHERFDAVIDGAVYGAVAGLGFATIENALYITGVIDTVGGLLTIAAADVQQVTISRALAGPGHVLYSGIAGYYLGLAKYNPRKWGQIVTKGLVVAALLHGIYNTTVGVGAAVIATLTPLSPLASLFVYIGCYLSLVGYYLYRKLDRYRRAYHESDAGQRGPPERPGRTEFDAADRK